MKVKITRFSNSYEFIGEIDATIIESPRWDNKSGGCSGSEFVTLKIKIGVK